MPNPDINDPFFIQKKRLSNQIPPKLTLLLRAFLRLFHKGRVAVVAAYVGTVEADYHIGVKFPFNRRVILKIPLVRVERGEAQKIARVVELPDALPIETVEGEIKRHFIAREKLTKIPGELHRARRAFYPTNGGGGRGGFGQ